MKLTLVYILILLVIYLITGRKKVKNISHEKEDIKPKNDFISGLSKFLIAMLAVYAGSMFVFCDMFIVDYWSFFGKKRTAEIESRYGIVVDDDVKLEKYKAIAHMEGTVRELDFKSNIDGMSFMKKNCNGELLRYAEDNLMQKLEKPDTESYEFSLEDGKSGMYWYKYQGREYQIVFYSDGDSYHAKIY